MIERRALVITPTYNESDSIEEVVRRLFAATSDVDFLVVDDGSPDGTADIVKSLRSDDEHIHLLEREGKLGLGTAYVTGFRWAIDRGYQAVVEMDADLSHDPADVPRLLDALENADLVIGSRYVPGGGVSNWSRARRLLSAAGNLYARAWLGYRVKDSTAGFRAYRTDALATQDLGSVRSEGYGFQIEMTRRFHKAGLRIREIPITFTERRQGTSKLSGWVIVESMLLPWALLTRRRRGELSRPG